MAMFICLVIALGTIAVNEQMATPQLAQNGEVNISALDQAGATWKGKKPGLASWRLPHGQRLPQRHLTALSIPCMTATRLLEEWQ